MLHWFGLVPTSVLNHAILLSSVGYNSMGFVYFYPILEDKKLCLRSFFKTLHAVSSYKER